MEINRNNCESYFFEYWEGNLNPYEREAVLRFLDSNPDLRDEFSQTEMLFLKPEPAIHFPDRDSLKKDPVVPSGSINEDNYDEFFVEYHEDRLSPDRKADVERFANKNPSLLKEFNAFKMCYLEPDTLIMYPDKESLKKRRKILPISPTAAMAAAASLLIMAGIYFVLVWNRDTLSTRTSLARMEPVKYRCEKPSPGMIGLRASAYFTAFDLNTETSLVTGEKGRKVIEISSIPSTLPGQLTAGSEAQVSIMANIPEREIYAYYYLEEIMTDGEPVMEPGNKTVAGKILSGIGRNIASVFDPVFKGDEDKTLIELSVEGYNLLADKDMQVNKKTDEDGNILSMSFESRFFNYSRSYKSGPVN